MKRILFLSLFIILEIHPQNTLNVPSQFATIQVALNAAQSGDTVLVQPGIYYENIFWPSTNGIKLIASENFSNTIIDGSRVGSVINFLSLSIIDTNTIIKGFTIRRGFNNQQLGAGISAPVSYPLLEDLFLEGNGAYAGTGGAISCGGIIIRNSTFKNNYARCGAGLYIGSRYSKIENVLFIDNLAEFGGAIYITGPNIDFDKVVMVNNRATAEGGAIVAYSNAHIKNITFINNSAPAGGTIYCQSSPIIYNNTFLNNIATTRGNIFLTISSSAKVNYNNFISNINSFFNHKSTDFADATSNYWGTALGPYSSTQNPSGMGDSVSGLVNILPFLALPDTNSPPIPVGKVNIVSTSASSIEISWNPSIIGDLKGYKVYWDTSDAEYSYINSVDAGLDTSFIIEELIPGFDYNIAVTCYDNSGEESWFSENIRAKTIQPILELMTSNLNFPVTAVGDSAIVPLKILSANSSPLTINNLSNSLDAFQCPGTLPILITGYDTLKMYMVFKPSAFGTYQDTLSISSNGGNVKVVMRGESPPPSLAVNQAIADFGTAARYTSSGNYIKVTNNSINSLVIDSVFTLTSNFIINIETPLTIIHLDTLEFKINFNPIAFGSFIDTLTLISNGGIAKVVLLGESPAPTIEIAEAIIEFGTVVRNIEAFRIFKIANSSVNNLVIDSIYSLTSRFSALPSSAEVANGDSLNVNVRFIPDTFGFFSDTLFIRNNSSVGLYKIPLSGNSPFQVVFSGATLNFGNIAVGQASTQSISLSNIFNGFVTIDSIFTTTPQFSVQPDNAVLGSLDTLELEIEFRPDNYQLYSDSVVILNKSLSSAIVIKLTGLSPHPYLVVNKVNLEFDSVLVNHSSVKTITLRDSSINDLLIDSIYTSTTSFSTTLSGRIIRSGESKELQVEFKPAETGHLSDTIYIVNNSQINPYKIQVTGIGIEITTVDDTDNNIPREYVLVQNYPNPFNPSTVIRFGIPNESNVTLELFDITGQRVAQLLNEQRNAGWHTIPFEASNLTSGIYFYRIQAGFFIETKKFILLR